MKQLYLYTCDIITFLYIRLPSSNSKYSHIIPYALSSHMFCLYSGSRNSNVGPPMLCSDWVSYAQHGSRHKSAKNK